MRNSYIKFCDKRGIKDGVLRELLTRENKIESRKAVKSAMRRRQDELDALVDLDAMLQEDPDVKD